MTDEQPNNPLHGVTLKAIMEDLVERHGWPALAELIPIRCFQNDPSLKSSLTFLRKTDWARQRVEALYLADQRHLQKRRKANARRSEMRARRATDQPAPASEADPPIRPK